MGIRDEIVNRLYCREGENRGNVCHRVAKSIWGDDPEKMTELRTLMEDGDACLNSPALMNATPGKKFQSSACFVLPVEDSLDSISELLRVATKVYRHAGGVGVDFSPLRAEDSPVSGGGKASGPVSFMKPLAAMGAVIQAGGRARKAATLVTLDAEHPDILKFIYSKRTDPGGLLSNINISVRVPRGCGGDTWDEICKSAWACGDPGVIFQDTLDDLNPCPSLGSCGNNPCAEFSFPPGSDGAACSLGSINLANFVGEGGGFDIHRFMAVSSFMAVALDRMIDVSSYPTAKLEYFAQTYRPIGLGVAGLALALIKMGMVYGSPGACRFTKHVIAIMDFAAVEQSIRRGEKFQSKMDEDDIDQWTGVIMPRKRAGWYAAATRFGVEIDIGYISKGVENGRLKNMAHTCIAPTGSISWFMGCGTSTGIEPIYKLAYMRKYAAGTKEEVVVSEALDQITNLEERKRLTEIILQNDGVIPDRETPSEYWLPFITAHEVTPAEHVEMAAAAQASVTMSVSKTVNLPADATVEDVDRTFKLAYAKGMKSITVYRDGCLADQPLSSVFKKPVAEMMDKDGNVTLSIHTDKIVVTTAPRAEYRKKVLHGATYKVNTPQGKMFATINEDEGRVMEILLKCEKPGTDSNAWVIALGRTLSIALQEGADPKRLATSLVEIASSSVVWDSLDGGMKPMPIYSAPDAIGKLILFKHLPLPDVHPQMKCPECGEEAVIVVAGCKQCTFCGWTKCG